MPAALLDALRERLRPRSVLGAVAVLAFLRVALDASLVQLATTVVTMAVLGLTDAAAEAYDLREAVRRIGLGVVTLVGGGALLAFDDGAVWTPVVLLAIGCWISLDAVQTIRHEGATVDEPDGREVYHDYVARTVHEQLQERPHTRRELSQALDAGDDAIDAAVERLRSRGVVERDGSELRVAPRTDPDGLARVRDVVTRAVARLARPVTLEFESSSDEGGASESSGSAVRRIGDSGSSEAGAGNGGDERESERQRETERR